MKKSFLHKPCSLILAILMMLSVFSGLSAYPKTQAYSAGDTIRFGTYPQTLVSDDALIAELDAAEKTWTSYRYYSGTGSNSCDGLMESGDWMRFADFFHEGEKYRAVTFDLYRPGWLYWKAEATGARVTQYNDTYKNGYRIKTVYYFKYEPLVWRVLDPQKGLVITESIIDSQSLNNVVYENPSDHHYYRGIDSDVLSNDYAASDLRAWMNSDFYATAFSDGQKDAIVATDVESALSNKIFTLSKTEAEGMGSNEQRLAYGTDYAKCQGLYVNAGGEGVGASPWTLRTSFADDGGYIYQVTLTRGNISFSQSPIQNCGWGVRLACRLGSLTEDEAVSEFLLSDHLEAGHTPGEPVTESKVDATCTKDGSYISAVYCSVCGGEISRTPMTIPATGEHDWQWKIDKQYFCYVDGEKHQYCTICGQKQNEGTRIPAAHRPGEWVDAVAPTCGKDGTLGHRSCTVCGVNFDADGNVLDSIIDPATGNHSYEGEEWTCYDADQHVRNCTVCGEPEYEAHDVIVKGGGDATCMDDGYTGDEYCSVCGQCLSKGEIIPAAGHKTEIVNAKAATATEDGYTGDEVCTVCGETIKKGETISASGEQTEPADESGNCPLCGKGHNGGIFDKLIGLLHYLIAFLRNLISAVS